MNAELWRVQLATGEVRMMTLDDLDRAFDAGYIQAHTNVLAPGSYTWTTLGLAAGLEDPVDQTPSLSPMALANGPSSYALPHVPGALPSFDVGDEDFAPRRSKKGIVFGFFVAAAAAACTFAVTTGHLDGSKLSKLMNATHAEPATVAAIAPLPEQKLPAPLAEAPKAEAKPVAVSDDVKKRLLQADKAREEKLNKAKGKGKGRRLRSTQNADGNTSNVTMQGDSKPLVESGDKFDPLNGSL